MISVNSKNQQITDVNGYKTLVIDSVDKKIISRYEYAYMYEYDIVIIQEGIIAIDEGAFCNSDIKGIILPNSLLCIGNYAFANCHRLTNVICDNNNISYGIKCFFECYNLDYEYEQNPFVEDMIINIKNKLSLIKNGYAYDFNGRKFDSEKDMCDFYGIKLSTFKNRRKYGMSIVDSLTIDIIYKESGPVLCKDHLGNKFYSLEDMCEYHKVTVEYYTEMINNGKSLKASLTPPIKDHLGNIYDSLRDMCKAYDITTGHYNDMIAHGASIEEALAPVYDHKGNRYKSLTAMCTHYHTTTLTFRNKLNMGIPLHDILEFKKSKSNGVYSKYIDHKGNKFYSKKELCKYWDISYSYFCKKFDECDDEGTAIKYAIEKKEKQAIYDHKGNKFYSKKELCKYWNISYYYFCKKFDECNDAETAIKYAIEKKTPYKDHLGNKFKNKSDMCRTWGISTSLFNKRIENGYSFKEAIEGKEEDWHYKDLNGKKFRTIEDLLKYHNIDNYEYSAMRKYYSRSYYEIIKVLTPPIKDHLGNEYNSLSDLCKAHCISLDYFLRRIRYNSIKNILIFKDYLGNKYDTKSDMCKAYNMTTTTYDSRIEKGWSKKKTLTSPVYKDHLGNEYDTLNDMCNEYNIPSSIYKDRIKAGLSKEKALTKPVYKDHNGTLYSSIEDMCNKYNIAVKLYKSRINKGWSVQSALVTPKGKTREYIHIHNYNGPLGVFTYNDKEFELIEVYHGGKYYDCLKYIGKETDGSKIKIPKGIIKCDYMFLQTNIESSPLIPRTVKSCMGMFLNCKSLKNVSSIPKTVENCNYMYKNCINLLLPPKRIPASVKYCNSMFAGCLQLQKQLPIPKTAIDHDYIYS
jgi:hypothetical protein